MKVDKSDAMQNFVIKIWCANHFSDKTKVRDNIFQGMVRNVQTNQDAWFNNAVDLLNILDTEYRKEEKRRGRRLSK